VSRGLGARLWAAWRGRRFAAWQVELTTRCPLACRMCAREGRPWRNRDMSLADFRRLAPHLRQVEVVVLQGWGEPLLHPDLVEIVRLAKGVGPDGAAPSVGFVTSGKGLDRRRAAALVDAGLDFVGFSLGGATAETHRSIRVHSELEEPVAAAELFREVKRDRGRSGPRTHAVFLMMRDNLHELPGAPEVARRMGAEELVLTNLIDVADAWQDGQRAFGCAGEADAGSAELVEEAERRAQVLGLPIRRAPLAPRVTPVCEEDPLRNVFVTVEGDVAPCVYLCPPVPGEFTRRFCGRETRCRRLRFGNLFQEPLDAIWEDPGYRGFRASFERRAGEHRRFSAMGRFQGAGGPGAAQAPGAGGPALSDPPEPCRACHKMLGV
jgi:MoaA/NifB/PqqE/SkfB family radical SAM enzyme